MTRLILICLAFLQLSVFAQQRNLKFKNETVKTANELTSKSFFSISKAENLTSPVYRILSFNQIPNSTTLRELKLNGIYLLSYQPDNSYIAKLTLSQAALQTLVAKTCYSSLPVLARYKLESNLFKNYVPDYAKKGESAQFEIQY